MAAPTPISSLVHSSTLVTAGIYLLIRFNNLFDYYMLYIILMVGSLTIFMAGLGANFEYDLKKIIALSTLRQLGFIMRILAIGDFKLTFFHLITHALFKATLFICAGYIIHVMIGYQDIRCIRRVGHQIPLVRTIFIISNMALCGLPFLSGAYSKDLILEFLSLSYTNIYMYIIFYISIGLTVSYTFRLFNYIFIKSNGGIPLNNISNIDNYIIYSIILLMIFILISGSILM